MRVVVTGSAGFIGGHLVRRLATEGVEVVGIDTFLAESYAPSVKRSVHQSLADLPGYHFIEADLRRPLPAELDGDYDAVLHLAAMPGLVKSWSDLDVYSSCNVEATGRLLDWCVSRGVPHFLQVSTSSVYGAEALGDEETPTRPVSPYGVTKLAAEHLVSAYQRAFGLPFTILRYFSVYGPGQRPDMAYHIMCEALLNDEVIEVSGDGTQTRSNTYVEDIVEGTVRALHRGPLGCALNLSGQESTSLLDAIDILGSVLGRRPRLRFSAPRAGDQLHTNGSSLRAERLIGYRATVRVEDGLRRQAEWHLARSSCVA